MAVNLKSKTARAALAPRREPYWHCLTVGLYLGYRRTAQGDGTWIARKLDEGTRRYLLRSLGPQAEFDDAVSQTRAWAEGVDAGASHKPTTITEVCRRYVEHLRRYKSQAAAIDADGRFRRHVYGDALGSVPIDRLRAPRLRAWADALLNDDGDEEGLRRSKDTANRNLASLKAALNFALRERVVATDAGWKTVLRYPKASRRRESDLCAADRAALLAHCDADTALFVRALMLTAARPGELAHARVADFDRHRGTMNLSGKTGRRTVTLSTAACQFFAERARDKLPAAPLLAVGGHLWNRHAWKKRFRAAADAAGLPEAVVLYTVRHAAISDMMAAGIDSHLVARLAGTSTDMIDKHYGHARHEATRAMLDAVRVA